MKTRVTKRVSWEPNEVSIDYMPSAKSIGRWKFPFICGVWARGLFGLPLPAQMTVVFSTTRPKTKRWVRVSAFLGSENIGEMRLHRVSAQLVYDWRYEPMSLSPGSLIPVYLTFYTFVRRHFADEPVYVSIEPVAKRGKA